MNTPLLSLLAGTVVCLSISEAYAQNSERIELKIRSDGPLVEASWPAQAKRGDGSTAFPLYQLQRSEDLANWVSVGGAVQGSAGGETTLKAPLTATGGAGFYRLSARFSGSSRAASLASGGAEAFGYADAFNEGLAAVGLLTPEQFASRYPAPTNYLAQLDWDVTTAEFWPEFNIDPYEYNANLLPGIDDLRSFDFRLDEAELALFKKNGFVVSERLGAPSCGEIFARLWEDDLPVYISADPILQAWHRSYDMMLSELEETYLFQSVKQMLEGMAGKVSEAAAQAGEGPLKASVLDADYLVTVGRSLLMGTQQNSTLGQSDRVTVALTAVQQEQLAVCFDLFGEPRAVDFSQFKPRGHYTESEQLKRYFRAVKWLGRTELRVAGGPFHDSPCAQPHNASPRELGTAIVLNYLLNSGGQFDRWQQFDKLIQTFVGWTDSMTFAQLGEVLRAAGVESLADVTSVAKLEEVQGLLLAGTVGVKNIRADLFISPLGAEQAQLPRSFTIFGGKFVMDSWALSKSVYDSIVWDADGVPSASDKVSRRVPSALDVAFSVFGNNQVVPEITARVLDQSPTRHLFRDGYNYQHNLAAVRDVIDQQPASAWDQNLYMGWLGMLRELSAPVTDSIFPDALRTRAWAMKDLNSQLASWTHLRHDTILYAEQSFTGCQCLCSYPKGYVDPRPALWKRFQHMATTAANLLSATDFRGTAEIESPRGSGNITQTNLLSLQARQVEYLQHLAEITGNLRDMSERELNHQPFTDAQTAFLQNTMLAQKISGYSSRWWEVYDGWYPKLFYHPVVSDAYSYVEGTGAAVDEGQFQYSAGALKWDALVADVHTDVPCPDCAPSDPGSVLHQATGNAHLMMVAINNGDEKCVYAGPVLSHYEFEIPGAPKRLSDPEWKDRWKKAGFDAWFYNNSWARDWSEIPPHPKWTQGYLAPIARE